MRPTFFKSPMLAIPRVTVRKIMGKVNIFIMFMKYLERGSSFRAKLGEYIPNDTPKMMAINT
jgi:hypothetical protein